MFCFPAAFWKSLGRGSKMTFRSWFANGKSLVLMGLPLITFGMMKFWRFWVHVSYVSMSPHSLNICKPNNTVDTCLLTADGPIPAAHLHWHCTIHPSISKQTPTSYEVLFFNFTWHSALTKNKPTSHANRTYFRNLLSYIYYTWLLTLFPIFLKYAAIASFLQV